MVGRDFQKPLQLLVAYGCYVFEDDVCVDPSGVPDERPNYANITFLELFTGPCIGQLKVMDEGSDFSTAHFSEFCAGTTCPPCASAFWGYDDLGAKLRGKKISSRIIQIFFFFDFLFFLFLFLLLTSSFSSFFFISGFSDSPFLIVINLVRLPRYSCKGSTKVVWLCLSWF